MIGIIGSNFNINVFIGWSFVVFLSCLYYKPKLTFFIAIFNYFVMMTSTYFKGVSGFNLANPYVRNSPLIFLLSTGGGLSIEYIFVFFLAISISLRAKKTYSLLLRKNDESKKTQLEILAFIPKILESHEIFTGHHVAHTVKYVELISKKLKTKGFYSDILNEETIRLYSYAANLHDIGKIHIPDNILNKPGNFTSKEYEIMKNHPAEGKKILEYLPKIKNGKFNKIAIQMAYYHHEKFDGTGYPNKISGKEIPLCARIMTAADVLDALLSWRPYKKRMDIEQVMQIFENEKGTHFEPCIAETVISLKSEIYEISQHFLEAEIREEEKEYFWRQQLNDKKNLQT